MTSPGLIDRRGLLNWADSIGARSELPRLIRRLILESAQEIAELGFPAGEGVSAASWDGTVRATAQAPYVPFGISRWELSVEKSAGTKADEDYAKRSAAADGLATTECTYVAVSLRPWTKRADWAHARSAEGRWKEVRALGVDDVETWLESAPITHAWLSELVGLHPHGLVTAQTWWGMWSSATTPAFPPAVVVAGREASLDALRGELSRSDRLVTIRGSSRDEVVAFVASLALSEASSDGGALLVRTAFIDDVWAWRRLRDHRIPLVLVALTDQVAAEFAVGSVHVLIVPVTAMTDADIELTPVDSLVAAEVLKTEGLDERRADDAGKLARLSLLAARRRLATKRELLQPVWAQPPAAKTVRRVVLIARWQEDVEADCALVEKTVGVPYDVLREEVAALAAGGDPLLTRLGGEIAVVSHFDAWLVLRGELRKDDLEAFHDAVRTVFSEVDARLEVPQEDRWRASLLGKKRAYSSDLRRGVATTLALLGAYGDRLVNGADITGREWAAWIVREVLIAANADTSCQTWVSLTDVLSLVAEAAPTEFLDAMRVATIGDTPLLIGMFGDSTEGHYFPSPGSPHPSLLWALETCAWSPDHFGLVVDLLARLAEIDPGGRLGNRPFGSLRAIFLPWHPQNSASSGQRLAAIDGLRDRHKEIAWRLLLSLLPEMHGVSMNISEPRFRDWKPEKLQVTTQEYWSFIDEIGKRVLDDVGLNPQQWLVLIDRADNLPPPMRASCLARLRELSSGFSAEHRLAIWEALRAKAARHREFAIARWALPPDEIEAFETTAARFEPTDPMEHYGWLFKVQMPEIPDIKRGEDYEEYTVALATVRAEAAAEIADSTDWDTLRGFALSIQFPQIFGSALAQAGRDEHEPHLLQLLKSSASREIDLAAGYFSDRFRTQGWSWLDSQLNSAGLVPEQASRLLLCTNDYPKAWKVAEGMGEKVAASFWSHFRVFGLGKDFADVDFVAERLLKADRPGSELDLIALYLRPDDKIGEPLAELMARGLEVLLGRERQDLEAKALSEFDLHKLFAALKRSELPRERVARLEWSYLPAFDIDGRPPLLNRMLSEDPDLFVDIIRRIYRPRSGAEGDETAADSELETTDETQAVAIATNAYRLLSEWSTIPGQREDGTVDSESLEEWVTVARAKLRESAHLEVGDVHIGHILAWGPADADGSRPCLEVRNLVESLQSVDVEEGLKIELANSRGVTSRGVFDGGAQERTLAAAYREQAKKFNERWPRTARLLRELAESYERDGRWHDEHAERRRRGLDN